MCTSYSFRRFFPTVADALELTETQRNTLGNWVDSTGRVTKEPMHARYSAVQMESCATVRRLCLQAVHQIQKHGGTDFEQCRTLRPHMGLLLQSVLRDSWGKLATETIDVQAMADDLDPPATVTKRKLASPCPSRSSSASSSSSSSSSSESAGPPPAELTTIEWLLPRGSRSLVHFARLGTLPEQARLPMCTSRPFVYGHQHDLGLTTALALNRPFCPSCVSKLPARLSSAVVAARNQAASAQ